MKYLADTNIFLEIILGQKNKEACKFFLNNHVGEVLISDFSLHSIGVILFRLKRFEVFEKFYAEICNQSNVISLPDEKYPLVASIAQQYDLDFDDSYQWAVSREFDLKIITQDNDFKKANAAFNIDFMA